MAVHFKFADNLLASEYYDYFFKLLGEQTGLGSRSRSMLYLTEIYSVQTANY